MMMQMGKICGASGKRARRDGRSRFATARRGKFCGV
jgi:hypothetical protein